MPAQKMIPREKIIAILREAAQACRDHARPGQAELWDIVAQAMDGRHPDADQMLACAMTHSMNTWVIDKLRDAQD